jgi:hypothetical protein
MAKRTQDGDDAAPKKGKKSASPKVGAKAAKNADADDDLATAAGPAPQPTSPAPVTASSHSNINIHNHNYFNPQNANSNVNQANATSGSASSVKEGGLLESLKPFFELLGEHKGKIFLAILAALGIGGGGAWYGGWFGEKKPPHEEKKAEPKPKRYPGSMAAFFTNRNAVGPYRDPGRDTFWKEHCGLMVNWDGYIQERCPRGATSGLKESSKAIGVLLNGIDPP